MKKLTSILALITVSAFVLSGCQGNAAQSSAGTQDAAGKAVESTQESVVTAVESTQESVVTAVESTQESVGTAAESTPDAAGLTVGSTEGTDGLTERREGSLHSSIQHVVDSPEWVVNLESAKDESVKQLFVVAGMGMDKTTATVSMHQRAEDGTWKQILSTPAFVGRNGLCLDVDHKEGCGQTPVGVYRFNKAFGIAPDPGCAIPYTQVTDDTYWSGDDREGMHYNEMVDLKDFPDLDMENSEHIVDYEYQYQYCLNISFNEDGTAGRGSAIFLHCFGPTKPYTGGCVALPENIMEMVMQNVTEDCVVVIDTLDNMGGSL